MNYIAQYPGSVTIYVCVLLVSYFFAKLANRTKKKGFVIALIMILTLFAGLRNETVGTDTRRNLFFIENSILQDFSVSAKEIGCRIVNVVLYGLFGSSRLVLIIYSFFVVYLFIIRLWELKDRINFPASIIVFFASVYLQSFNLLRQSIAISIVFYGLRYLEQNKIIKFYISIILATSFHLSAPAGLLIFIVHDLYTTDVRKFKPTKIFQYAVLIGVALFALNADRTQLLFDNYFTRGQSVESYSSYFTIVIVVLLYIIERVPNFVNKIKTERYSRFEKKIEIDETYNTYSTIYLIGMLISALLSGLLNASRVTYYYLCLSTIFYTYKNKWEMIRNVKILFCILLVIRDLYNIFLHSGMGVMPYIFFWE